MLFLGEFRFHRPIKGYLIEEKNPLNFYLLKQILKEKKKGEFSLFWWVDLPKSNYIVVAHYSYDRTRICNRWPIDIVLETYAVDQNLRVVVIAVTLGIQAGDGLVISDGGFRAHSAENADLFVHIYLLKRDFVDSQTRRI